MGADEPAFVKHAGLGLVYSVPHDREDPTKHPQLLPFVQRIGKYLLNHSFMIPGFIGVGVSTVVAYTISQLLL
jgi:hypothetical protein